jgi:predicted transcriptional regulator of viral defense system
MPSTDTKDRTLSKTEARLILEMEWREDRVISLEGIQSSLSVSAGHARFIAHRLVQKGWFERLRRGVFQLIPADRGREAIADTNAFLGVEVFRHPMFYSFGTACSYYGFTDQVFTEMYVATTKARPAEEIRGKKYIFAAMKQDRFFGSEETKVFGRPVPMATPERAVLDALERPQYAGGLPEVSRIIKKAGLKLDLHRLIEYARSWKESALVQRLGYFLDLHQIQLPSEIRTELKSLVKPDNKIYLAPRGRWKMPARLNSEWIIVENVPKAVLTENAEGRRPFVPKSRVVASRVGEGGRK